MCSSESVSLGFTDRTVPAGTHMCFIYDGEAERRSVMAKYLHSGLDAGEKVAYFADAEDEARSWLADLGVDASAEVYRNLQLAEASTVYTPDGHFDPDSMFTTLRRFRDALKDGDYSGARASGEMSWALRGVPGSERLVEYEAGLNHVLPECGITGICQYDVRRFDGATILDVLRVHPLMVVRGQVVENPYYMTPEQFLEEYAARR